MSGGSSSVSLLVKYALFFLNILFWLIGLGLLAAGIYARTLKEVTTVLKSSVVWYLDPSLYLMIFGGIIFILAFLGCIGSLRENLTMLKIFEYSIDFIMFLQLGAAIGIYLAKEQVKNGVKNALVKTIPQYRDDVDLQSIIDFFQENVKCCGVNNYMDWDKNIYFNCSSPGSEACGVPYSCCKHFASEINTQCGYGLRKAGVSQIKRGEKIYTTGCVDATINLLLSNQNMYLMIGIGVGVILLQLIATGLAHSMINGIRSQIIKQHRPPPFAHGLRNTAFN